MCGAGAKLGLVLPIKLTSAQLQTRPPVCQLSTTQASKQLLPCHLSYCVLCALPPQTAMLVQGGLRDGQVGLAS